MGHQVLPIQESNLEWAKLPGMVEGFDLFAWTRTAGFDPPDEQAQRMAVRQIGEMMPTVGFHLDRWWGLHREANERGPASENPTPFFNLAYLFTADGGHDDEWRSIGANHYWSPPGVAKKNAVTGVYRRHLWAEVGFVGNLRNYGHAEWQPYRKELYRRLTKLRKFRIWEGGVRGQMLADLYASVNILIGDSCLAGGATHYWSDRIPETLGRAGFLIHPEVEGLAEEFPAEVLPTYPVGDFDQLLELVAHYLDDRELVREIGETAQWWVREHHTYHHRWQRILEIVG